MASLEAGGSCSIARTLAVVGERWSLLVVRESLKGRTRFSEFQEALQVSTDVLADRLDGLVTAGILERHEYREPGQRARSDYHLTPAGRDLLPVLAALMGWGDAHLAGDAGPPSLWRRRGTAASVHVALVDEHGRQVDPDDIEVLPGPGATVPPAGGRSKSLGAQAGQRRRKKAASEASR